MNWALGIGNGGFALTLMIDCSSFSISPGLTSGRPLRPASLTSLLSILRSSCGMLFFAYRSRRSNKSRTPTSVSRCRLKSSSTPSSHALASSSRRFWLVERCFAVEPIPSLSNGTSFVSVAYVLSDSSVKAVKAREKRRWSAATPRFRFAKRSRRLHRLI